MKHKISRILLAEINPDIRSAMALLLETRLSARVIGEADSMECLLSALAVSKPDIVIMDWELPGFPKEDRAAVIRSILPGVKIVVTSSRPENADVGKAMQADSFVCKSDTPEQVIHELEQL
jgi:DNA-binding NarL/FixJ family response regulator